MRPGDEVVLDGQGATMNILGVVRSTLGHFGASHVRLLRPASILLNVLALVGFFVRDRSILLAYLLYLPLVPIGVAGRRPGFSRSLAAARHLARA